MATVRSQPIVSLPTIPSNFINITSRKTVEVFSFTLARCTWSYKTLTYGHRDVVFWFQTSLASLQTSAVDVAYGFTDPALAPFSKRASKRLQHEICNNQVLHSLASVLLSLPYGKYTL
jgi:hypothetical protein